MSGWRRTLPRGFARRLPWGAVASRRGSPRSKLRSRSSSFERFHRARSVASAHAAVHRRIGSFGRSQRSPPVAARRLSGSRSQARRARRSDAPPRSPPLVRDGRSLTSPVSSAGHCRRQLPVMPATGDARCANVHTNRLRTVRAHVRSCRRQGRRGRPRLPRAFGTWVRGRGAARTSAPASRRGFRARRCSPWRCRFVLRPYRGA